jgi:hypothetical protein
MGKKIIFFVFLISLLIFIKETFIAFKYYSKKESDTQISVLNQKISYLPNQNFNKLLSKVVISFNLHAKYNNLGTIEVLFDTNKKNNHDWLWFRIKEKNSPTWYYQNKYKTDHLNTDQYFPFGFPIINNSKNKEFRVEIESISGTSENSVSINKRGQNFIAKYSYSKSYLNQHKFQIIMLTIEKTKMYFDYIPVLVKIKIIIYSLIPFIVWLIITRNPLNLISRIIKFISNKKLKQITNWLTPAIIFFITFLVSGFFSTIGTDPHHDGILIKPAVDLLEGKMLFKDSFTQYGALITILQTLALKLFGKYLLIIKLETAFFYGLTSVLLYFIWSRFMSKKLSFLSSIILLFLAPYYIFTFLPWSSVYALFFQCLTLYFLIKNYEKRKKRWLFFAGVATALTFWSKQNIGAFVLLSSIFSIISIKILAKKDLKSFVSDLTTYFIGGIFMSTLFFLWIIPNRAFTDWWKQTIVLAGGFIEAKAKKNTSLISHLFPAYVYPSYIGFISIWAVMPILTIIAFLKGFSRKKPNNPLIFISLSSLFSWLQYYPVTDIRHVFWAATPMVGITIYLLYELSKSVSQKRIVIKFLLFIFLIWAFFYPDIRYRISNGYKKITNHYYSLKEPKILVGMKLSKDEATFYSQTYTSIINYKKTHGDVNFITISPNALYLTFAQSNNFHPFYASFGNTIYPDYYIIRNNYISEHKPIIMSIWGRILPGYCRLNNLTNIPDTAFLIVPCE